MSVIVVEIHHPIRGQVHAYVLRAVAVGWFRSLQRKGGRRQIREAEFPGVIGGSCLAPMDAIDDLHRGLGHRFAVEP